MGDYAVAIKPLASSCEYSSFLKDAMRDRFVSGIRNQDIQQRRRKMRSLLTSCMR